MLYHAFELLDENDLSNILSELMSCPDWVDGALSASELAKKIKRNLQLFPGSETYKKLNKKVCELIMEEKTILAPYIFPKKIVNTLFSRTSAGMFYGKHVDSSHIRNGRRDFSFTIFLNNPQDYEGGQLVLYIPPEKKSVKLEAGSIIIYPTKYLHEVKEVTKGERIVCAGWIESYIKKDNEREILSHISTALIHTHKNAKDESIETLNVAFQSLKKYFGD